MSTMLCYAEIDNADTNEVSGGKASCPNYETVASKVAESHTFEARALCIGSDGSFITGTKRFPRQRIAYFLIYDKNGCLKKFATFPNSHRIHSTLCGCAILDSHIIVKDCNQNLLFRFSTDGTYLNKQTHTKWPLTRMAYNQDHIYIISSGRVRIFTQNGDYVNLLPTHSSFSAVDLAFHANGRYLYIMSHKKVEIWDVKTKKMLREIEYKRKSTAVGIAVDFIGNFVIASSDGQVNAYYKSQDYKESKTIVKKGSSAVDVGINSKHCTLVVVSTNNVKVFYGY